MFVSICTVDVYHCLPVDVCFHHVYFKKRPGRIVIVTRSEPVDRPTVAPWRQKHSLTKQRTHVQVQQHAACSSPASIYPLPCSMQKMWESILRTWSLVKDLSNSRCNIVGLIRIFHNVLTIIIRWICGKRRLKVFNKNTWNLESQSTSEH